ncbi:MAG TPA: alanine racemase, partial [Phycisphaerae bacterium]|nr:alanine racemase [Phycisphaerae bacterium]
HFATADERDKTFALQQLDTFLTAAGAVGISPGGDIILHAANSAATIDLPQSRLDMVRPGLAVYGYQPSDQMHNKLPLKPSLRLTSRLLQIKNVPAGYADGLARALSNKMLVTIQGQLAPVRGRISMDQIIIDLTDIPSAAVGDKVELISPNPAAPNSVENLAIIENTIPYEIICRLGQRPRRTLVETF